MVSNIEIGSYVVVLVRWLCGIDIEALTLETMVSETHRRVTLCKSEKSCTVMSSLPKVFSKSVNCLSFAKYVMPRHIQPL